jgi:transcriptional regulator with XRE-family HTH domain
MPREKEFKNTWLGKIRKAFDLTMEDMAKGLGMTEPGYRKAEAEKNPTTWSGILLKEYIERHTLETLEGVFKRRGVSVRKET